MRRGTLAWAMGALLLACAPAHAATLVSITTPDQAALRSGQAVSANVTVDRQSTLTVTQSLGPSRQPRYKLGTTAVLLPLSAEALATAASSPALSAKPEAGTSSASKTLTYYAP